MAIDAQEALRRATSRMGGPEWAGITVEVVKGRLVFSQPHIEGVKPFLVNLEWLDQEEHEIIGCLGAVLRQLGRDSLRKRGKL